MMKEMFAERQDLKSSSPLISSVGMGQSPYF